MYNTVNYICHCLDRSLIMHQASRYIIKGLEHHTHTHTYNMFVQVLQQVLQSFLKGRRISDRIRHASRTSSSVLLPELKTRQVSVQTHLKMATLFHTYTGVSLLFCYNVVPVREQYESRVDMKVFSQLDSPNDIISGSLFCPPLIDADHTVCKSKAIFACTECSTGKWVL